MMNAAKQSNRNRLKELNQHLVQWLDQKFYSDVPGNWDNDIFRQSVLKYINSKTVLLDAGAGRGALPHMNFRQQVAQAIGVDPEESVAENPYLHKSHVGLADDMPFFEDATFDVVVSNNVLEHVEKPDAFYSEVGRVLKPGGVLITKTPNFWHYMPIIASLTPLAFHKFATRLRGRPFEDTFPTVYKANTESTQRALADRNGFDVV